MKKTLASLVLAIFWHNMAVGEDDFSISTQKYLRSPIVAQVVDEAIDTRDIKDAKPIVFYGSVNDPTRPSVAIRMLGPKVSISVSKKRQIARIFWIGEEGITLSNIASLDYVATITGHDGDYLESPPPELVDYYTNQKNRNQIIGTVPNVDTFLEYAKAQTRIQKSAPKQNIAISNSGLFKLKIFPPKTPVIGRYSATILLFDNGSLAGATIVPFKLINTGTYYVVTDMAQRHKGLYGTLCILTTFIGAFVLNLTMARRK